MRPFSKRELIGVTLIFLIVFAVTYSGLLQAVRRARDSQRKADLGNVSNALGKYYEDFGFYPPSKNGKIIACKGENFEEIKLKLEEKGSFDSNIYFSGLRECEWGKDSLRDVLDDSFAPYLPVLPQDPKAKEGYSYYYISNTRHFQLYSFLEGGEKEVGYSDGIASRNLYCGKGICSFGKANGETPLDVSLEDYEEILEEKRKSGT